MLCSCTDAPGSPQYKSGRSADPCADSGLWSWPESPQHKTSRSADPCAESVDFWSWPEEQEPTWWEEEEETEEPQHSCELSSELAARTMTAQQLNAPSFKVLKRQRKEVAKRCRECDCKFGIFCWKKTCSLCLHVVCDDCSQHRREENLRVCQSCQNSTLQRRERTGSDNQMPELEFCGDVTSIRANSSAHKSCSQNIPDKMGVTAAGRAESDEDAIRELQEAFGLFDTKSQECIATKDLGTVLNAFGKDLDRDGGLAELKNETARRQSTQQISTRPPQVSEVGGRSRSCCIGTGWFRGDGGAVAA